MIRKVMIVAGEASGDLHGGNLIRAAKELCPQISFFGVGGDKMKKAGAQLLFSSNDLSVMGVQEVVGSLPRILRRFFQLKSILQGAKKPDLLVLIDFPDFNLRLAKAAKTNAVPVLYYISPKVWAWRAGRARTIAARVDRLALIFPFEAGIYERLGVTADYVGNPLLDEFSSRNTDVDVRRKLGIDHSDQVVGIFPGSRNSELKYIFPTLMETARQLVAKKSELKFLLPVAPSLSLEFFKAELAATDVPITLVEDDIYAVCQACDAVLTVSGTVTLQLALTRTPMTIVYRVAPLSYLIGRLLIKVSHIGLANIVAGRTVVREFIQDAAEPQAMCEEVCRLLDDQAYRRTMIDDLTEVKESLGSPGCSQRVARIVGQMTGIIDRN